MSPIRLLSQSTLVIVITDWGGKSGSILPLSMGNSTV